MLRLCPRFLSAKGVTNPPTSTLVLTALDACHATGHRLMAAVGPTCSSRRGLLLISTANLLCLATYGIMVNWIYEGYVDLWYGVYGLDDDEDDD